MGQVRVIICPKVINWLLFKEKNSSGSHRPFCFASPEIIGIKVFMSAPNRPARYTNTELYVLFIFCIKIIKYNHLIIPYCFFFAIRLCSDTQNTSLYHRTWSPKTRVSINLEKYQLEKQKAYHVFVWARSLISLGWFISFIINWFILKLNQNKKKV